MRVLVVRAAHQAEATARALAEAGHTAVLAPILSIVPIDTPPPDTRPNALLVTSRNAVTPLKRHRASFAGVPVFAVGPRTAHALADAGIGPVEVAGGDGTALARCVAATMPAGARLLHVSGRERRPEPARMLVAAGYAVDVWETYAAEPADNLPRIAAEALETGTLDAVLHYSPRSATQLSQLVAKAGLEGAFAALRHHCLSSNVAAALPGVPRHRMVVAKAPSEALLLAELGRAD